MIMESIYFGRVGVERRRYAVEGLRFSLARLYRPSRRSGAGTRIRPPGRETRRS
jgi:hypothetical protein